jgi:alcohol dehydrogenase class IV
MYERKVDLRSVFKLQPARPVTYFGAGAINKTSDIARELRKEGITSIVVITGKTAYKTTGAWKKVKSTLEKENIRYELYDKVRANPTYEGCEEAARIGEEAGAKAFLAIGGGSAIDTAKTAAVLIKSPEKRASDFYEKRDEIKAAAPVIAINTTHGTGSETNAIAVTQSDGRFKPFIASPYIYPAYSIEDPELTLTLSKEQTIFTAMDALNHVTEATTSSVRNPYSMLLGIETVRLVKEYLPVSVKEPANLGARYWLMYASALGGISFDIGLLHITHSLEHTLSALKPDVAHGSGLIAILPAVVKQIYPALPEVLADLYRPIIPDLRGSPDEAYHAAKKLEEWIFSMGATEKLSDMGFAEEDLDELVKVTGESPMSRILLPLAPIAVDEKTTREIFRDSLHPMQ